MVDSDLSLFLDVGEQNKTRRSQSQKLSRLESRSRF